MALGLRNRAFEGVLYREGLGEDRDTFCKRGTQSSMPEFLEGSPFTLKTSWWWLPLLAELSDISPIQK